MKLFEAISAFLAHERAGKPVFGLMGDANLAFLGRFIERDGGNYIAASEEGGAVLMADGYARMSGHTGVASVTHGPALTNTLTALREAVMAKTPLVLLAGDTPTINEHFQYVDIEGFARFAGAQFERVKTADSALTTLQKAFTRTRFERRPVVVDIPYRLLKDEVDYTAPSFPELRPQVTAPDPDLVDEALGLLLSAKRPLLLAGLGAVESGARDALLTLARGINSPVMTTLLGRELFAGEPENLGIHGTLSTSMAVEYMGQADVVIAFGASLNNWTTDHYELMAGKKVIQVDADPAALAKYGPIDLGIVADAQAAAEALTARLVEAGEVAEDGTAKKRAAYLDAIAAAEGREAKDAFTSTTGNGFMDAREASLAISQALPAGTAQVHDVGRYSYSVWPHISVTPGRWHYAGHFGSIGLGTGFGVGAAAVDTSKPTVAWVGDGGAMHGIAEINTAARHELPLVVVVLNDQCYGAEYLKLQWFDNQAETSFIPWSSFAEVGQALGARAVRVTNAEELETAIAMIAEVTQPVEGTSAVGMNAEAGSKRVRPLVIEIIADPHKMVNVPTVS